MNIEQVKELLPDVVLQIAELIGFSATIKLIDKFGGTTFPIGKGLRALGATRANLLIETIGEDNAKKLMRDFGGEIVYLPRCVAALRELRNRKFLAEFATLRESGISALMCMTELCPKYGFSDRKGWELLAEDKAQATTKQQDLF